LKILDKYLLKTFLITFTTVFVILFFIFILQTVWLFISELAGKDLSFFMVIKFLLFSMPRIIPLVLPLSVLLASIMTFGSLAENYEFAAIKSAGISLKRAMKYLTYFILFLSVITFFFANNVIPYAEYKFINFRRNLAQVQPAMAIVEGQFSEIGNYTIKVAQKTGENGNFLKDVTIHIKSNDGTGLRTVIKAKTGTLVSSKSSNILKLVLKDGFYYEEVIPKKYEERKRIPFAKASFVKDVINIDLSKLNTNMDTGEIANTNTMLTISQLKYTIDSLNVNYKKDINSFAENLAQRNIVSNTFFDKKTIQDSAVLREFKTQNLMSNFLNNQKLNIYKNALSTIESNIFSIESSRFEMNEKMKNINEHWISLYDKIMIALSCVLMFFIGAPLGAIIRKGGLGLPIVLAVGIFIIFHFINTFGKKVAQEDGISPFFGTWLATLILLPLAVTVTYRATNDIGLISFDNIIESTSDFIKKIFPLNKKKNQLNSPVNTITNSIENIESSKKDFHTNTFSITNSITQYNKYSSLTLITYLLLIISFIFLNKTKITLILIAILILVFSLLNFKTYKKIYIIEKNTNSIHKLNLLIILLLGVPFYILIYLFNKFRLKEIINK
jgi:lipopolysaccharide export system permease protein